MHRNRLDGLIEEAIRARGPRRGVDLILILDRVDSREKWLLGFEELSGGLRRLGEEGSIAEVEPGVFRATRERRPSVIELSRESYDQAVTQYHDEFAESVVKVFGSWPMRAAAALVPGNVVDLEATRLSFLLERLVDRAGGHLGEPLQANPLTFPVAGPIEGGRDRLVRAARSAIADQKLAARDVRFLFDDGDEQHLGRD